MSKHPRNFDLAYNKARLQFEISEQPGLVTHLPVSLHQYLQQALQSQKYALSLNEENTDILFNTAELLISLAENVVEDAETPQPDNTYPASLLHEALELLDSCFTRQSMIFEEQRQAWERETDDTQGGVSLKDTDVGGPSSPASSAAEQSATVESSVTPEDLVDTLHASLAALTQLVGLDSHSSIPVLSSMAESILTSKLPPCIDLLSPDEQPPARQAALLLQASFTAAVSAAEFDATLISGSTYLSRLAAFETLDLATNAEVMCNAADAAVEAIAAISSRPRAGDQLDLHAPLLQSRNLYASALAILADQSAAQTKGTLSVTTRPDPAREATRAAALAAAADAALLSYRLFQEEDALSQSVSLYRQASSAYQNADDITSQSQAHTRGLVAAALASGSSLPRDASTIRIVADMRSEGLLGDDALN